MADVLLLAGTTQSWISRRTDRLVFVDQTTARRVITLDLSIPDLHAPDEAILPVGLFRTGIALGNFTITDETGRRLAMLNRRENVQVVTAVIDLATEGGAAADDVHRLANGTWSEREEAAVLLLNTRDSELGRRLIVDLVHNYLMLLPLKCVAGEHRTITITFEEPLTDPSQGSRDQRAPKEDSDVKGPLEFQNKALRDESLSGSPVERPSRWRRLLGWLRLTDHCISWRQNSLGDASSFHVEVEVPVDLEVSCARLHVTRTADAPYICPADDVGPRAHLYARSKQAGVERWKPGTLSRVEVWLRPRDNDVLVAGLVLAGGSAALLGGGSYVMDQALDARDGAAPLLLAGPTLLSAYLARPGAHPITARMLRGPRTLIAIAGLLVFASTAALFVPNVPEARQQLVVPTWLPWCWRVAAVASAVAAALLALALIRATRQVVPEDHASLNGTNETELDAPTRPATVLVPTEAQRYVSADSVADTEREAQEAWKLRCRADTQ